MIFIFMGTLFFRFLKFNSVCSLIVCIDRFLLDLVDKFRFYNYSFNDREKVVCSGWKEFICIHKYIYIKQGKHWVMEIFSYTIVISRNNQIASDDLKKFNIAIVLDISMFYPFL